MTWTGAAERLSSNRLTLGTLVTRSKDFRPLLWRRRVSNITVVATRIEPASILSETECWKRLSQVSLGRLVTSVDGQPAIFPVNFAVQQRTLLFRTAEGTKLVSAAINDHVLFEADDHDAVQGWSVIVKGTARTVRTDEDIEEAERAQLQPWTASAKKHFVRIRPLSVTGRQFVFGSVPDCE